MNKDYEYYQNLRDSMCQEFWYSIQLGDVKGLQYWMSLLEGAAKDNDICLGINYDYLDLVGENSEIYLKALISVVHEAYVIYWQNMPDDFFEDYYHKRHKSFDPELHQKEIKAYQNYLNN